MRKKSSSEYSKISIYFSLWVEADWPLPDLRESSSCGMVEPLAVEVPFPLPNREAACLLLEKQWLAGGVSVPRVHGHDWQ